MRRLPDDELLESLRDKAAKLGRTPTVTEVGADPAMPDPWTYWKRFGGYLAACRAAGLSTQNLQQRRGYESLLDGYLRRTYGISEADYWRLNEEQDGRCAICRHEETGSNGHGPLPRLSVDHCHQTGVVRGLLCVRCNQALGHLRDSVAIATAMTSYLLEDSPACLTA